MIKTTLSWIADQVDGKQFGEDVSIHGVSTDTRHIKSDDLFIALVGPNFNAHHFIDVAEEQGAKALVVSEEVETTLPYILVEDTKIAMGKLGNGVRRKVNPTTIGITGSSGKTTVKEMVASILSRVGKVLATQGNFNNDIGVPLTLLRLEEDHDFAVVEMGANHLGEIAYTTKLSQPDIATIVNAAAAHLEGFGSLLGVARAKSEIFKGLSDSGIAMLNSDSQFKDFWLAKVRHLNVQTFGETKGSNFNATDVHLTLEGNAQFTLETPSGNTLITLSIPGLHNVSNALCAASLCMNVGATLEDVKLGLQEMQQVTGRLNVKALTNQVRILDDTYNANVASVNAAVDLLASFSGRRILILGDMGELGEKARYYHEQVGEYAKNHQVDELLSLGVLSQSASDVYAEDGHHFTEIALLVAYLETLLVNEQQDICILVKGSRAAKMERVVGAIEASSVGKRQKVRERVAC